MFVRLWGHPQGETAVAGLSKSQYTSWEAWWQNITLTKLLIQAITLSFTVSLYELILQTRPLIKFKNASTPNEFFANKTETDGKWFVSSCTFGSLNDSKNINM